IPWATATERKNPQRPEFKIVETVFRTEPAIIARIGLGIANTTGKSPTLMRKIVICRAISGSKGRFG
ncbi:MAG: hypothetical protein RR860_02335, partial [Janthinobacterium sp.]